MDTLALRNTDETIIELLRNRQSDGVSLLYDKYSGALYGAILRVVHSKEIAEEVYRCWQAGAAIAHIHVRDDNGIGSMSVEKFTETVELIRAKCDIVLNLTTSGDLDATDETRMQHLINCLLVPWITWLNQKINQR